MSDINDVVIIANQMNLALSICSYRLEQIDEKLAEQNEILKQGLITIALCIRGGNENGKEES